jgi:hypothetical protein
MVSDCQRTLDQVCKDLLTLRPAASDPGVDGGEVEVRHSASGRKRPWMPSPRLPVGAALTTAPTNTRCELGGSSGRRCHRRYREARRDSAVAATIDEVCQEAEQSQL